MMGSIGKLRWYVQYLGVAVCFISMNANQVWARNVFGKSDTRVAILTDAQPWGAIGLLSGTVNIQDSRGSREQSQSCTGTLVWPNLV